MKKRYCLFLSVGMMFLLTGCHSNLKAELQTVIDTPIEAEDTYTPSSYDNYLTAVSEAKLLEDKAIVSAGQLEDAKEKVEAAIENLYIRPDKTALIQKIDQAQQIDQTKYIPNSTTQLIHAIDEAIDIFENEDAINEEVETAIADLDSGITVLVIKPDKSALEGLIKKAKDIDQNNYTTVSCNELEKAISVTSPVVNNENATQGEVDNAYNNLNNVFDAMVKATKGVYRINCSLKRVVTNHVGNEWTSSITYNGKQINNGDTVTASLNSSITLTGTAIENDSIPDYGSGSVCISLDGGEESIQFYVRENRGRYAGNLALWELTGSATLIERI